MSLVVKILFYIQDNIPETLSLYQLVSNYNIEIAVLVNYLLKILLVHGYIKGFFRQKGSINIFLKQNEEGKGLRKIQQISRSKQRVYVSCKKLPTLENGLGLLILSTPKGVCTSQQAQKNRVGGEILCQVF